MNLTRWLALAAATAVAHAESPYGPFSDEDFPFHTCTLDLRNLGNGHAKGNLVPRAIVLKLGEDHYACWDPDLLRIAAFWKDGFVEMGGMAAHSYPPGRARQKVPQGMGALPKILGTPIFTNGQHPGWSSGNEPSFKDPRPRAPNPGETGLGALPPALARWNGIYRTAEGVTLSYEIAGIPLLESPRLLTKEFTHGLSRNFQLRELATRQLNLVACEVPNAHSAKIDPKTGAALLYHDASKQTVTAVGLFSPRQKLRLAIHEDRRILVQIPKGTNPTMFQVVTWRGRTEQLPALQKMLKTGIQTVNVQRGGPATWLEVEHTKITEESAAAGYVVEELPLPLPNRWKRNVRPTAIAKLSTGMYATVTFDGDVWLVYGLTGTRRTVGWKRFAAGLHEPLSICVTDGKIHVLTRNGIIRLHDFNNDKEADFYENFCNLFGQTAESREYANSLAPLPDGGFILTKGGQQRASQGRHNNHLLKVSADGRTVQTIAHGLRQGFAGTHPEDGRIYATDQQGNYVPSTPVHLVKEGSFLGFKEPDPDGNYPPTREPLCWVPHKMAPSGTHMQWTAKAGFGPLSGRLLLVDYHNPGLLQVFQDTSGKLPQGGVHRLPFQFKSPILKTYADPDTGDLYLAGLQVFGSKAKETAGIRRIRHTGRSSAFLPIHARSTDLGLLLTFSQPLDLSNASHDDFKVQRWNYLRSKKYGSGHYKLNGKPGQEPLPIANIFLSKDSRQLLLAIPEMKSAHQIEAAFQVRSTKQAKLDDKVWLTAHHLPKLIHDPDEFQPVPLREPLADNAQGPVRPPDRPSASEGRKLHTAIGCIGCHTLDGQQAGRPGPTWKNLFGSQRKLADGQTVRADEAYLRESILDPGAKVLEGFADGEVAMPPYQGILTDSQVDSLLLFIKSL